MSGYVAMFVKNNPFLMLTERMNQWLVGAEVVAVLGEGVISSLGIV